MENNNMSFFHGQASDGSRVTRSPSATQGMLLTSHFLQTANNRCIHTSSAVNPVSPLAGINQPRITAIRPFNTMRSNDRFVFMPTPSLSSSTRINRPTTSTNPFGFGMMNSNPSAVANRGIAYTDALGTSLLSRPPLLPEPYFLDSTSPAISFSPRIQPPHLQYQHLNHFLNINQNSSRYLNQSPDLLNQNLLGSLPREEPYHIHKCGICHIEFPTPQAYGGHTSSRSKFRKAEVAFEDAWFRSKKPRVAPVMHEQEEDTEVFLKMAGANIIREDAELKKEEQEEEDLKDDGVLNYIVEEDQNIETDEKVIAESHANSSENSVNSDPKTNGGTTPSNVL